MYYSIRGKIKNSFNYLVARTNNLSRIFYLPIIEIIAIFIYNEFLVNLLKVSINNTKICPKYFVVGNVLDYGLYQEKVILSRFYQ